MACLAASPDPSESLPVSRVTFPSKHVATFEGGNALSTFRALALLVALQSVDAARRRRHARHVHWVRSESTLDGRADKPRRIAALRRPLRGAGDGILVVVAPRLGTVSPWA